MCEGAYVPVEERLLGLIAVDTVEGPAGCRQTHHKHPELGEHVVQVDADAAEVDLGLVSERMGLRDHHLGRRERPPALSLGDVTPNGGLRDRGTVLVNEPLPDPAGRVALLSRHRLVGLEPGLDGRSPRPDRRRAPYAHLARWRHRRRQRLADGASVHLKVPREFADRGLVPIVRLADLLV